MELKVTSAQDKVDQYKGLVTKLFKQIKIESISEFSDDVKFLGHVFKGDSRDLDLAVIKLLQHLEESLFIGFPEVDKRQITGLESLVTEDHVFTNPEDFYLKFEELRKTEGLQLFELSSPEFIGEGDLPKGSRFTFAVNPETLTWQQLMPVMQMPLCSMREGRLTASLSLSPVEPFKLEDSLEICRTAVLMYGCLRCSKPESILMLVSGEF